MALGYFETTTGQKQLADIGRKMMDMSEYANCKGMKEEGFKELGPSTGKALLADHLRKLKNQAV